MFDSEYFKNLLNETTALMAKKGLQEEGGDEAEARIESNVAALKYLARGITDEEVRSKTLKRIDRLCLEPEEFEVSEIRNRGKGSGAERTSGCSDRMERDILEYSKKLHGKALKFAESVDLDGKVLREVTDKMSKNLIGTSSALRSLRMDGHSIPVLRILVSAMVIFVVMYFVIRFL